MKNKKKYKNPITDVYFHRDLIDIDIANMASTMTTEEFYEFYDTYTKAVEDSKIDSFRPNTKLYHELIGWSRLAFFSMKKPDKKFKQNCRFIYRYDGDNKNFYKLAVGFRNADGINADGNDEDSVYHIAKHRPKEPESENWEKETD